MLGGIVCCQLMERTFGLQWAIQSPSGATNLRRVGCVTRWGCAFEWAASAGGAGHMPLVSGMTSQSSGTHWCQCWSLGKGVRQIGATKALLQPTQNALVSWRLIQTPLKYSSGFGAGRRLSTNGLKNGPYCQPRTVMTSSSTKQFLVQLKFLPSFLLRPTLCFK